MSGVDSVDIAVVWVAVAAVATGSMVVTEMVAGALGVVTTLGVATMGDRSPKLAAI